MIGKVGCKSHQQDVAAKQCIAEQAGKHVTLLVKLAIASRDGLPGVSTKTSDTAVTATASSGFGSGGCSSLSSAFTSVPSAFTCTASGVCLSLLSGGRLRFLAGGWVNKGCLFCPMMVAAALTATKVQVDMRCSATTAKAALGPTAAIAAAAAPSKLQGDAASC